MVEESERHLHLFAESGADIITVHLDATRHLYRILKSICDLGKKAGVALEPATPLTADRRLGCFQHRA